MIKTLWLVRTVSEVELDSNAVFSFYFTTKAPPLHRSKNHTKLLRVHFLSVSLYSRTSYPPLAKVTNIYNVIHL